MAAIRASHTPAVRSQLCRDLMETIGGASVDVTVGLVLLLCAPAMRRGSFTVGDLALFTTYAGWLTGLPRWTGKMLARSTTQRTSGDRMGCLPWRWRLPAPRRMAAATVR